MELINKETNDSISDSKDWSQEIESVRGSVRYNYDDCEIIEALELQKKILNGVKKMNRIGFEVIHNLYVFIESKFYLNLGWDNFKEWIISWGGAPSTFYRYLAIYRLFTVENKIPVSEYESVDITKLNSMMPLAKYAKDIEDIKTLIIDADEFELSDCHLHVREEIERHQRIDTSPPDLLVNKNEHNSNKNIAADGLEIGGIYRLIKLTEDEEKDQALELKSKISLRSFREMEIYCEDNELHFLKIVAREEKDNPIN